MLRRLLLLLTVAAMMALTAVPAFATIHPIVESADCANVVADEKHPLGDVADPPGQTPGDVNPADKETGSGSFTALSNANAEASSKFDGQCGTVCKY
jgi:hypothetical protein